MVQSSREDAADCMRGRTQDGEDRFISRVLSNSWKCARQQAETGVTETITTEVMSRATGTHVP